MEVITTIEQVNITDTRAVQTNDTTGDIETKDIEKLPVTPTKYSLA